MDTPTLLSRRSLLKASPVVAVAALMPSLASAASGAVPADIDEVAVAIARHRQARAALDAAYNREEEIEQALNANPRYDASRPKVQYSRLLVGPDLTPTPLYAYSIKELDQHCEERCGHMQSLRIGDVAKVRRHYAALRSELASKIRRKQRYEQLAGLPAADRASREAADNEEIAAVAVLLARPRNAAEADLKRRYMRGKSCFKAGWWDAHSLLHALKVNLGLEA